MSDAWPADWVSGAEKMSSNAREGLQQDGPQMANDHGIVYLLGDMRKGEWLQMMDTLPPRLQNNP